MPAIWLAAPAPAFMPSIPLFWVLALLLVAATVAALVWPLLRQRAASVIELEDVATADVFRDQKRQLDAELAAGAITRAERDAGLEELALRLGSELDAKLPTAPGQRSARSSNVAALILVAALPVSALMLYVAFGDPAAMRAATVTAEQRAPISNEQLVAMVEKLATRMKEHPEDPAGWRLLARTYSTMGRFEESVTAFAEAATRGTPDAALLADWADALAMHQQSLQGEPSRLVDRALALDPHHVKALALAASAALERKDYDAAIAEWRRLQAQFPAGSEETKQIGAMIAEADAAKRGAGVNSGAADATAIRGAPPGGSNAAASDATATRGTPSAGSNAAAADATAITGKVSLDSKLRERAAASDTLFIFARAVNGPRMPLAVVRTTVAELPRAFKLDDSMAMTPAARLSTAGDVVVEARVSKTGSATPSPGDLQGSSVTIKPGASDVSVVINDVVR